MRIIVPAPEDYVFSYTSRDLLGSHLEILDVVSGQRRIIYSSAVPFEAPNWTPDGKALIYNSAGRLYRFDLASRSPEVIDTGFATRNNNDHVLSFDGTMLAISHHSEEDQGNAIVYVLPSSGGTPRRVTAKGPSYLHGWSPDGRFLVYTGMRDGAADIYRIAVDGRRRDAAHRRAGARRRPGIHARRAIYLFQFRTQRQHANLAHAARRQPAGTGDGRRVQ